MTILSLTLLAVCLLPLGYLYLQALAAVRPAPPPALDRDPSHRFVIAIPAHDEAGVIEATVRKLLALDYPQHLFSVHIVADHCSDETALLARSAGAVVHERGEGPRTGKGAALSWLLERVLDEGCDAVAVFDADTQVDAQFLRVMDARLAGGDQVVQGRHVISNPEDGWYPALMWAMFMVDNRFQNLGRVNLGCSAKLMGDSVCFRADVLRRMGWGAGLTEDFQLRQRLLLEGVCIGYEPAAVGCGEAALTWAQAQAQRKRWLRGTHDSSQQFARRLLVESLRRRDAALVDGALQAYLPSYSTLTVICGAAALTQALINWVAGPVFHSAAVGGWGAMLGTLFVYPLIGLALERAPLRAYGVMLSGPFFILWRTWLALVARVGGRPVIWIRTAHGGRR
jgi:cellulose synthase/poly-beta-1,6-N-acetylglucosamine synthase-like glycosyltransferase